MLLALETSCDETSVAVMNLESFFNDSNGLKDWLVYEEVSSQIKLHEPYGGVVPELAAREHVLNLPVMVSRAFEKLGIEKSDIDCVSVTRGPGLKGCLLVGLSFAKAFCHMCSTPMLALNHLEGHIFAGELAREGRGLELPLLALVVSGGHSLLVYSERFREYKVLASTRDDAAGEAFDKAATLLALPYPGGPSLAARAAKGNPNRFKFPIGVRHDENSFSFSGLKTAVMRAVLGLGEEINEMGVVDDLAASVEWAIVTALVEKTLGACRTLRPRTVLLSGGVAANETLRAALAEGVTALGLEFVVPPRKWCTDNAAMVGALGARVLKNDAKSYDVFLQRRRDGISVASDMSVDARARWSLEDVHS